MLNYLKSEGLSMQRVKHYLALTLNRVEPFNHSQRRYQRIAQSVITALAGKGIALIVSFISVPLTINYLGIERYGVWVTISTFLAWLQIADLGLGNGLINALAEAYGTDRPDLAKRYVATTFWMLTGAAVLLGVIFGSLWFWIDWSAIFNVHDPITKLEIAPAIAIALGIALCNLPLLVIEKVLNAYQEGAIANYWAAAGNLGSLLGIIFATQIHGGLILLVLVFSGSLLIVKVFSAFWLFKKHKPWLAPKLSLFDSASWRRLSIAGAEFFLLQIAALTLYQSDNLVIAHYLGAENVTSYSVVYRLFTYIALLNSLIIAPLWPAYGEALARADWEWAKKTFQRTLTVSMVVSVILIASLIVFSKPIIAAWTHNIVKPNTSIIILIAIWTLMSIWGNHYGILLNGLGVVRAQLLIGCLMAFMNLFLSIFLVQRIGVIGVILATILSYSVTSLWIVPMLAHKFFNQQVKHPVFE